ncbi:cytochrome c biogenesis protein CcdA [bacterium]|nr:cytochrome c biogenesis protein CcdA [bacterium]
MFGIGIFSAFLAGLLSFISPCVLPLVPVYLGIMTRNVIYKNKDIKFSERIYILLNSFIFVLGFTIVFVILGSTATFLGQLFKNYIGIIGRIGGAILIVFGLHYVGLFKIPFLNFEKKFNMPSTLKKGYIWSFLFGVIFSFGWVPCVGLILSSILLLASKLDTVKQGILLLTFYSLGLGFPFILASLFISFFSNFLKRINRHINVISIISGVFIILLGIIFLTDSTAKILAFTYAHLPFLSKINF